MTTRRIAPDSLRSAADAMLRASGSGAEEAAIVSRHLVEANLAGHDSHGVGLLPMYLRDRASGRLHANRHPHLLREDGAIGIFDAGMGYGHVMARDVTNWGLDRAAKTGFSIVAMRNSHHVARLGSYAEQAFARGMISILFVNVVFGEPRVAVFGGTDGRLHTNPVCIGVPGSDEHLPFLLDFATSRIAIGKVRVAYEEKRSLPPGTLIDASGAPTSDPAALFETPMGAILPFGEHKGSGLAVACEILAGALTGGVTNQSTAAPDRGLTNSLLGIFVDPARFTELPVFHKEIAGILAHVKASPAARGVKEVLTAGEPERIAHADRSANGIPVHEGTWREIGAAAAGVGVDLDRFG